MTDADHNEPVDADHDEPVTDRELDEFLRRAQRGLMMWIEEDIDVEARLRKITSSEAE